MSEQERESDGGAVAAEEAPAEVETGKPERPDAARKAEKKAEKKAKAPREGEGEGKVKETDEEKAKRLASEVLPKGRAIKKLIAVSGVVVDRTLQLRAKPNRDRIDAYARKRQEEDSEFPPVDAYEDPEKEGVYYLWDGWHRYAAATGIGQAEIWANIKKGTLLQAQIAAMPANRQWDNVGIPREYGDMEKAVRAALASPVTCKWSSRVLAAYIGCTHTTVLNVKRKIEQEKKPVAERDPGYADDAKATVDPAGPPAPSEGPGDPEGPKRPEADAPPRESDKSYLARCPARESLPRETREEFDADAIWWRENVEENPAFQTFKKDMRARLKDREDLKPCQVALARVVTMVAPQSRKACLDCGGKKQKNGVACKSCKGYGYHVPFRNKV